MRRGLLVVVACVLLALAVSASHAGPQLSTETYVQSYVADAGALPTGWTTAYDVDFTTLGTQTFANGNVTIDGKTWTAENSTCLRTFDLQNGTGIRLYPSTTICDSDNPAQGSQPNWTPSVGATAFGSELKILLSSLVPSSVRWPRAQIRLYVQWDSSGIDQNYERFQYGLQRSDDTYGWRIGAMSGNNGPSGQTFSSFCYSIAQNNLYTFQGQWTTSTQPAIASSELSVLTLGPNYHYCERATWTGSWPSSFTTVNMMNWGYEANGGATRIIAPSNLQFWIGAYNVSTQGNAVVNVKRLRVDYKYL